MYRIVKKQKGYIVEVQVFKWYFLGLKKSYKPFIKSSGLDCAWHHSTFEYALQNLVDEIKFDLRYKEQTTK